MAHINGCPAITAKSGIGHPEPSVCRRSHAESLYVSFGILQVPDEKHFGSCTSRLFGECRKGGSFGFARNLHAPGHQLLLDWCTVPDVTPHMQRPMPRLHGMLPRVLQVAGAGLLSETLPPLA